jgi:hypothetical protein
MTKTLPAAERQQMLRFKDALSAALCMAAKERPNYQNEVQESELDDAEIEWAVRERRLMLDMVNRRRAQLGMDGVTEDVSPPVSPSGSAVFLIPLRVGTRYRRWDDDVREPHDQPDGRSIAAHQRSGRAVRRA